MSGPVILGVEMEKGFVYEIVSKTNKKMEIELISITVSTTVPSIRYYDLGSNDPSAVNQLNISNITGITLLHSNLKADFGKDC